MQLVDQPQSSAFSSSQVFMMQGSSPISIAIQSKDYQTPQSQTVEKEFIDIPSTSTPPSFGLQHIERPNSESII